VAQKANPKLMRLGIVKDWENVWYAEKDYPLFLLEDLYIRDMIKSNFSRAAVSDIKIKRMSDYIEVIVKVARPGVIFGKSGIDLNFYKEHIVKKTDQTLLIFLIKKYNF
jgi:small subunit ribosomal protein S3